MYFNGVYEINPHKAVHKCEAGRKITQCFPYRLQKNYPKRVSHLKIIIATLSQYHAAIKILGCFGINLAQLESVFVI